MVRISKTRIFVQKLRTGEFLRNTLRKSLKSIQENKPVKQYPVGIYGVLDKVAGLNLPVPSKVKHMKRFDWPLDITKIDFRTLRGLMSYYTAQISYANYTIARLSVGLSEVELRLKRRNHKVGNYYRSKGRKRDEISGLVEKDKDFESLENTLIHAEGLIKTIIALRDSYQLYVNDASRELTARQGEFRNIMGKSGEGK